VEGDPCGSLTGIGCCTPNGTLFYCSQEDTVVQEECGA
jgi:hypothetical protein